MLSAIEEGLNSTLSEISAATSAAASALSGVTAVGGIVAAATSPAKKNTSRTDGAEAARLSSGGVASGGANPRCADPRCANPLGGGDEQIGDSIGELEQSAISTQQSAISTQHSAIRIGDSVGEPQPSTPSMSGGGKWRRGSLPPTARAAAAAAVAGRTDVSLVEILEHEAGRVRFAAAVSPPPRHPSPPPRHPSPPPRHPSPSLRHPSPPPDAQLTLRKPRAPPSHSQVALFDFLLSDCF